MKPNIFVSYSRREVGFVDDLTYGLEKEGFQVWLDYRSLIPGTPWDEQIDKGLDDAQVILIVVSKDSLASHYVELEWRHALEQKNKRIILVIFEAVQLPPDLKKYEWVDFRGKYNTALKQLVEMLQSPVQEKGPAPEKGFKAPGMVWLSIAVSAVTGLTSLFAFWTVLLPLLLIPLPFRIMRRNFNFAHIQAALWFLPVGILVTNINIPEGGPAAEFIYSVCGIAFLAAAVLWFLIRSREMQRWGKPEATMPRFANPYHPNNPNPKPVSFFIDHDPADEKVADRLAKTLTNYKHPQASDIHSAQAVFVLISAYKTDTEADPEKQAVYPVLVQSAHPSPKLSKVQWIDFRRGVRDLDDIAQLLPEPARLLSALGVRPTGSQIVLPPIINWMSYLMIVTMTFAAGAFIGDFFTFITADQGLGAFLFQLVCLGAILWLGFRMVAALRGRRGRLASVVGSVTGYIVFGIFVTLLTALIPTDSSNPNSPIPITIYSLLLYIFGGIILTGLALTRWRADYQNWLPWSAPKTK